MNEVREASFLALQCLARLPDNHPVIAKLGGEQVLEMALLPLSSPSTELSAFVASAGTDRSTPPLASETSSTPSTPPTLSP